MCTCRLIGSRRSDTTKAPFLEPKQAFSRRRHLILLIAMDGEQMAVDAARDDAGSAAPPPQAIAESVVDPTPALAVSADQQLNLEAEKTNEISPPKDLAEQPEPALSSPPPLANADIMPVDEPMSSSPPPGSSDARPLNVTDALGYLDSVKMQFTDEPNVYNKFLDIMKEFKSQTCVAYTPSFTQIVADKRAGLTLQASLGACHSSSPDTQYSYKASIPFFLLVIVLTARTATMPL
jgi:hypothetical protein